MSEPQVAGRIRNGGLVVISPERVVRRRGILMALALRFPVRCWRDDPVMVQVEFFGVSAYERFCVFVLMSNADACLGTPPIARKRCRALHRPPLLRLTNGFECLLKRRATRHA